MRFSGSMFGLFVAFVLFVSFAAAVAVPYADADPIPAPISLALPAAEDGEVAVADSDEVTAQATGIYICRDTNWGGPCFHPNGPWNGGPERCYQLDGSASSFGPDPGLTCNLYTDGFCSQFAMAMSAIRYPGIPNLGNFNDRIRSFQCFWL
ncbi:hypothetical protein K402DRAFT_424352 [Aulographum hederae CBS 113979]|uniref:Uncharacterized protein n=1 Tax=Aulographum hederae CBS 113979 TaxID=1176131 RepID=A0A6G1GPR3_9PEZI|nr:hypothetical protein K402DRAFT_424352 [Aulographum hederae CBS 113979]